VEAAAGRPFSGRGGRQLFRWLAEAGLGAKEEARESIYLTSITKCFPGPASSGSGDRRPSPAEVELCQGHLDSQLELLRPWLVLAVGQMAVERFLGSVPMHLTVGRLFSSGGVEVEPLAVPAAAERPLVLPLPHPSGASRWLNSEENRALLARSLRALEALLGAPPRQ
jgi:uracil-DNA glycosylase